MKFLSIATLILALQVVSISAGPQNTQQNQIPTTIRASSGRSTTALATTPRSRATTRNPLPDFNQYINNYYILVNNPPPEVPEDYRIFQNSSDSPGAYYKLFQQPMRWASARVTCVEEGGHLFILRSLAEEVSLVFDIMDPKDIARVWMGIHDPTHSNNWVTVTDVLLTDTEYVHWSNQSRSQYCGALNSNNGMIAVSCDSPLPFVCKIEHEVIL